MADLVADAEKLRDRLDKQLDSRRPQIERYERYYDGRQPLAFATVKFREAFGNLFRAFADNWCGLIVDSAVERLTVTGFRFGDDISRTGDDDAWRMWQANNLDAESLVAHTEAVKCAEAYVLVAPPVDDPAVPVITVEHPKQMIVAHAPGDRRKRLAAWKKWLDESGYIYGTLYLPDHVVKWRSKGTASSLTNGAPVRWVFRDEQNPSDDNPFGEVPVVALRNNPSMLAGGRSDLHDVIPIQDAINKIVGDMIVASEFAAFRQRVASGLEIPDDPSTGQQMTPDKFREIYVPAVSRLWTVGDPDVKWTEFEASDLGNYVKAIELLVQHVAAQTRVPPHYMLGQVVNLSADALKAAETGLVSKARRKQLDFSDPWEEAMRLAFTAIGDDAKAKDIKAETLWRDPESRTEAQKADAAIKMQTLGVPWEFRMEYLGYSPQEIKRMKLMKLDDALEQMLSQPDLGGAPAPAPPAVPAPVPQPAPAPVPAPVR